MKSSSLRLTLFALCSLALVSPVLLSAQSTSETGLQAPYSSSSPEPIPFLIAEVVPTPLPDAPSTALVQQTVAPPAAQTATPPADETEAQRKERERLEALRVVKEEERQRIGGVLPNFNTVIGGTAPPITAGEKWNIALHSAADPYYFGLAFVMAGFGEIDDSHAGYHWGPGGYFKRVGANFVDNLDGILIGNALLPAVLHQDPRYFRKGTGSIPSRIVYSALSTVICRGDNGHKQFNISNVGGNLIAGALSNIYYPSNESGVGLTFENALQVTYVGAIGAQLLEFSPDISSYIHRKRQAKRDRLAAAQASPPQPAAPAKP